MLEEKGWENDERVWWWGAKLSEDAISHQGFTW